MTDLMAVHHVSTAISKIFSVNSLRIAVKLMEGVYVHPDMEEKTALRHYAARWPMVRIEHQEKDNTVTAKEDGKG